MAMASGNSSARAAALSTRRCARVMPMDDAMRTSALSRALVRTSSCWHSHRRYRQHGRAMREHGRRVLGVTCHPGLGLEARRLATGDSEMGSVASQWNNSRKCTHTFPGWICLELEQVFKRPQVLYGLDRVAERPFLQAQHVRPLVLAVLFEHDDAVIRPAEFELDRRPEPHWSARHGPHQRHCETARVHAVLRSASLAAPRAWQLRRANKNRPAAHRINKNHPAAHRMP